MTLYDGLSRLPSIFDCCQIISIHQTHICHRTVRRGNGGLPTRLIVEHDHHHCVNTMLVEETVRQPAIDASDPRLCSEQSKVWNT